MIYSNITYVQSSCGQGSPAPGQGGLAPFPPLVLLSAPFSLNPSISPTSPVGFGIGHSLASLLDPSASCPSAVSSLGAAHFRRLRRLGAPSGISSPSAYANRGAGHGRTCGRATTKKLAKRVVAKRVEVNFERGWRRGGMILAMV